jgi:hypothetical protein
VAAIGEFLNSKGFDANDDGNLPEMLATLIAAFQPYSNLVTYNAPGSGVFVCPPGCVRPRVRLWGGGGAGGAITVGPGSGEGGGGGGYLEFLMTTTPGQEIAYQVGAAGIGGNSSTPNGGNGGTTSFGVYAALGGNGGQGGASGEITGGNPVGGGTIPPSTNFFSYTGGTGLQAGFLPGFAHPIVLGFGGPAFGMTPILALQGVSGGYSPQYACGSNGAVSGTGGAANSVAGGKGLIIIEY